MKVCPYCAEDIPAAAEVCPLCGESIGSATPQGGGGARGVSGPPCPQCGRQNLQRGAQPWYLGTVGTMVMRVVVCNSCGHEFDARKPQADLPARKRNLAFLLNGIGGVGIALILGALWWFIRATMRH